MTKLLLLHYDALPAPGSPGQGRRDRIAEFAANGWSVAIAIAIPSPVPPWYVIEEWFQRSEHIESICVGVLRGFVGNGGYASEFCKTGVREGFVDSPRDALSAAIAGCNRNRPDTTQCIYVGAKPEHAKACNIPGLGVSYMDISTWLGVNPAKV